MSTKIFQTCFTTKWFSQFWIRTDERFSTVSLWTEIPKITIFFQNLHHHLFFLFGIFYGFHFVVEVEVARSPKKVLWSWILSFLILEGGYYLLRKTNTMYFFISFNGYYSVYLLFVFLVKWPILNVWLWSNGLSWTRKTIGRIKVILFMFSFLNVFHVIYLLLLDDQFAVYFYSYFPNIIYLKFNLVLESLVPMAFAPFNFDSRIFFP